MNYAATEEDVDVFMSGFAFRLKIMHDRGLSLLKGQRKKLFLICLQDSCIFQEEFVMVTFCCSWKCPSEAGLLS